MARVVQRFNDSLPAGGASPQVNRAERPCPAVQRRRRVLILAWRAPRSRVTVTSKCRVWQSVDGRYRVVRARSLFGLPTVYYALRLTTVNGRDCWLPIEWSAKAGLVKHRKKGPAFKACEKDHASRN